MSIDRKLAWASLVLALPGTIVLFRDENYKTAVLIVLLLIVCVGALVYHQWFTKRPGITVEKLTKTLTIFDDAGKRATLLRCQEFTVNYPNVDSIWFRNIVSDGKIVDPLIDGDAPDEEEHFSCLLSVQKQYPKPLAMGERHEVRLEYGLEDSFPEKEESLLHDVDISTRKLILEVRLPANRACKEAQLHILAAGTTMHQIRRWFSVSADKRQISATIRNPRPGHTYEVSWTW